MFCPVGYRPAAELWAEYRDQRLEIIYESVVSDYGDPEMVADFVRGSPLDVCEHSFLKTLCVVGIHLASPTGQVVRVHIELEDGFASLLSVLGPYESVWQGVMDDSELENSYFEQAFKGFRYVDWRYSPSDEKRWSKEYSEISERKIAFQKQPDLGLKHHDLPNHFVRPVYTIATEVPPWAIVSSRKSTVAPILAHFSGWSMCIDAASYESVWQDYLKGRKQVFDHDTTISRLNSTGRPGLKAARTAFRAMNCDKGALSWEQVARKIQHETGKKPSHKTLRNWRDQYKASE
ncbi:hypothetical protein [Sedimentitalea todarodis]|uniref:Primase C-terminal 2 domain-containing protein n=1 Tax=Sedimentitalea todarodis TaxID=1631240 RepID=A0ABU3V8A6_9RHOB|nr:hypothetical protein [Sedimentitalea todarodis]MDU9002400.1 hypothetical protein [Sedimentitalea todarodis]